MNEPLKGKMYHNVDIVCGDIIAKRTSCCKLEDLESAIKWLKSQIRKGSEMTMCKENILKRIDDAFPDLCPSGDLIADKQKRINKIRLKKMESTLAVEIGI